VNTVVSLVPSVLTAPMMASRDARLIVDKTVQQMTHDSNP
jgi:hypothetical protein